MKKRAMMVVGVILTLSLLAAGSALAHRKGGYGGYGMMGGTGFGCWAEQGGSSVDLEAMTKFRKETLPLRDELLTKRLELAQEYDKESPDADRISGLRKEVIDIQGSIQKVADKYDMEPFGQGRRGRGGAGFGYGGCPGGRF